MELDLVIFDCDGVLVDSEPISNVIFADMLAEAGLSLTLAETVESFLGRSMEACVEMVEERLGRRLPPDFLDDYEARILAAFEERRLQAVEGVRDALARIPYPTCVASSGSHSKMRTTLRITGLAERFRGRVFSSSDVERGKPYPDLFLHAARSLGASPSRCAVIEDAVPGVLAGVAAGMRVLGYAGRSEAAPLERAGALVFRDMKELPGLLERAGGSREDPDQQ